MRDVSTIVGPLFGSPRVELKNILQTARVKKSCNVHNSVVIAMKFIILTKYY